MINKDEQNKDNPLMINDKTDDKINDIDVKKLVGKRIREYRQKHKMSQEAFAEVIEIDSKHLSNIELGKNMPNPQLLLKIARTLNIEIKDLFEFYHLLPPKELKDAINTLVSRLNDEQLQMTYKYIKAFVL